MTTPCGSSIEFFDAKIGKITAFYASSYVEVSSDKREEEHDGPDDHNQILPNLASTSRNADTLHQRI